MTSLLSIFDPSSNTTYSNWLTLMLVLVIPFSNSIWSFFSVNQQFYQELVKNLSLLFKDKNKSELIFVSLFMFILITNFFGLIPYSLSFTSYFTFNLSLSMTFWLSSMFWGLWKNINSIIAHLTPMGSPMVLVPFLVLVETMSKIIQPFTLSLRLMSNIMAGHMIISLLCLACFKMNYWMSSCFYLLDFFFLIFELIIIFIQSYVFSVLSSLYWKDTE